MGSTGVGHRRAAAIAVSAALLGGACAQEVSSVPERADRTTIAPDPVATTAPPATSTATTGTAITTTTGVTTTTTTGALLAESTATTTTLAAPPTSAPPNAHSADVAAIDPGAATGIAPNTEVEIGRSVEGRPVTLFRRGTPDGVRILVVGVIHGNEQAGLEVVERLRTIEVPAGIELFVVPSMNPDGLAAADRQNANQVDLNRNFPENWGPLGVPGDWQYGGPSAASEPETQTMVALGAAINPSLVFWYHQDLFRIAPGSGRDGEIRTRFAELTGLPVVEITGGTYTGTASQWAATVLTDAGVGITVELGPTIAEPETEAHARAILAVAQEYFVP